MDGTLPNLHDAVLESLRINFAAGSAELHLLTARKDAPQPITIVIEKFRRVSVDRDQPWGPSSYVMEATGGNERLDVLMQSGDHLLFYGPEMTVRSAGR